MSTSNKRLAAREIILYFLVAINLIFLGLVLTGGISRIAGLLFSLPLLVIGIMNTRQRKHSLLRNYPLLGYFRYWLESIRPEIRQYFFESDLDGKPFNRRQRSIVYQRSKNEK